MFVSTRLSSSGPGHHHRDDKLRKAGLRGGALNCFRSCPPRGGEPSIGGKHAPRRGNQKKKGGGRELRIMTVHPQDLLGLRYSSLSPTIIQTVRIVYKPSCKPSTPLKEFVQTVQTVYKPSYKPCTALKEFVQTVQTVHPGGNFPEP